MLDTHLTRPVRTIALAAFVARCAAALRGMGCADPASSRAGSEMGYDDHSKGQS
jgi:predicted methyltransferase